MSISLPNHISHDEMRFVRGQYNIVLGQLRRENPDYRPYIGCFNPYSDRKIKDAADFDEYLRQLAISDIYKKLYNNAWENDKKTIESQREEIKQLKRLVEQANEREEQKKRTIRVLIIIVLVLLFAIYWIWRY